MTDYKDGKIYKIVNTVNDKIYIGSTKQTLKYRMYGHKGDSKRDSHKNYPFFQAVNEIGIDKFHIELIKEYPCENNKQLVKEEYKTMREMKENGIELYNDFIGCHSEETKRRIIEKNTGRVHSESAKQKMSEAHKGEKNYFYGKHHSEDTKQKLSKSLTGKFIGEKNPFYGKQHTEQSKKKISETQIKGGCIIRRKDENHAEWLYSWNENGKSKQKSFSIKKYGEEGAIHLCRDLRKTIHPGYTPKYCEWFYIVEKDEFLVFPPS
jgi:group I intron endonuclease